MRKILFLSLILLVSVSWAVAQQDTTQPGAAGSQSASPSATPQAPTSQAPMGQPPSGQMPSSQAPSGAPSAGAPSAGSSSSAASSGNSVEGCLGGSAGKFTIIDKAGTTYQLQLPQGADSTVLNKHIGEEIRVSGTMSNAGGAADQTAAGNPSAPSAAGAAGAAGAGAAGGQPTIAVSRIDKVADTCSTNATPAKP